MSEYTNFNQGSENSFENTSQAYHYENHRENGDARAPQGGGRRGGRRKAGRIARKAGAIALSAVLFGGVASGTFLGINYAAGYTPDSFQTQPESVPDAGPESASASSSSLVTATSTAQSENRGSMDVSDIASAVMPSIVSITNRSVQEVQNYFSMFGYGGQIQTQETESCGSGIVIGENDSELLIVTNYHVVENADTLSACFIDNQAYEANLKGADPDNDLAVIAIPLENLSEDTLSQIQIATIGDSDALKVGEQVVAIGNALGYGQSVTTGIVSATDRTLQTEVSAVSTSSEELPTYIQTDAAINPGNSGGALVNMNGEVVGINSAKLASTEVEGMGYAIPVSRVSDIIETLMNETTRTKVSDAEKSSIGITGITVNEAINQAYDIPAGVYVAEVTEGSGAAEAGIRQGDVITAFDGREITDIQQLQELLQYYSAGETVEVALKTMGDGGYVDKTVSLTLSHAADSSQAEGSSEESGSRSDVLKGYNGR
ncbi:MAG TPA: trypsin-like peptidase domain-containing protein [Candidatus Eisenbergiella merdigallinarum]|uniref:Trypsin-like peptidase domain-containing protein n=1 Tax=Candidatus Eisenbergiella merdigallinarum TaxID=2838552 RepID=A0A9D2MU42_9FIRM|nr:trypsin-like peptidase domain-containing protein [Candidatus Eisenbergiella merdigallinarum]